MSWNLDIIRNRDDPIPPLGVTVCCTYSPPQSHRHRPNSEERRLVKITMQERQSQEGRGKRDTEVREGGRAGWTMRLRARAPPSDDPTDGRQERRKGRGRGRRRRRWRYGRRGRRPRRLPWGDGEGGRRRIHLKPAQTYKLILMLIL